MSDMNCPYCNAEQDVNHDDGEGYDESQKHEHECSECGKNFTFRTTITYRYEPAKADCLNDGNHQWYPSKTYPKHHTRMLCRTCDDFRDPTPEEKAEHGIPERPGKAGRTTPEESAKPYPTTYLNAGLDAVYITVRAGEAQCQRAIPREIVLDVKAPEQRIGGIVLKQIKVVDSINAAAKEKQ